MSVAKLFSPGRQFDANVFVNSLTLAPMTTAERLALDETEGLTVYDTTVNQLMIYANGAWNSVFLTPTTGKPFCLWTLNADAAIPLGSTQNPCNVPIANNAVVRSTKGGMTVSPAGVVVVPMAGIYEIKGCIRATVGARLTAGEVGISIRNFDGSYVYAQFTERGYATPNTVSLTDWNIAISATVELVASASIAIYMTTTGVSSVVTADTTAGGVDPLLTWFSVEYITT